MPGKLIVLKKLNRSAFGLGCCAAAALIVTCSSALACQTFIDINLANTLRAAGVILGEVIAESRIPTKENKHFKNKIHFDIKDIIRSNKPLPESIVVHYHSYNGQDPLKRRVRYVFVVDKYNYEHPSVSGDKRNILMSAVCGGSAPYVFPEESEAGRAIKQIFADDGVSPEVKAKILSRFVGLYGRHGF